VAGGAAASAGAPLSAGAVKAILPAFADILENVLCICVYMYIYSGKPPQIVKERSISPKWAILEEMD
jgi:hypothetical protein